MKEETSTYDTSTIGDASGLETVPPLPDTENPSEDDDPAPDDPEDSPTTGISAEFDNTSDAASDDTHSPTHRIVISLLKAALSLIDGSRDAEEFRTLTDAALAAEAIGEARREGEIAGRNAIIEERLETPPLAVPDLSGTPLSSSRRRTPSIFDIASQA